MNPPIPSSQAHYSPQAHHRYDQASSYPPSRHPLPPLELTNANLQRWATSTPIPSPTAQTKSAESGSEPSRARRTSQERASQKARPPRSPYPITSSCSASSARRDAETPFDSNYEGVQVTAPSTPLPIASSSGSTRATSPTIPTAPDADNAADDEAYAFHLFRPTTQSTANVPTEPGKAPAQSTPRPAAPMIRLTTPPSAGTSTARPRPQSHYIHAPTLSARARYEITALSGSHVRELAAQPCPGLRYAWRVITVRPGQDALLHVHEAGETHSSNGPDQTKSKRTRVGKKTRLKRRLLTRQAEEKRKEKMMEKVKAKVREREREAHLKDKKAKENRRKQVKKREKGREKRAETNAVEGQGGGGKDEAVAAAVAAA